MAQKGPFFHQSGRFQGVRRPKFRCGRSRQFDFSRCPPETGRFGRFLGPRGPKWNIHFFQFTQKERCAGRAECTQVTLFPYNCWVFEEKTRFGGSQAETRFEKRPKMAEGHWEKLGCQSVYARIRKTPLGGRTESSLALSPSVPFFL